MKKTISKDTTVLYNMLAMLRTAKYFANFLIESKSIHFDFKNEVDRVAKINGKFIKDIADKLPKKDYEIYMSEWDKKDFNQITEIMTIAAELPDDKRTFLENYANELKSGTQVQNPNESVYGC